MVFDHVGHGSHVLCNYSQFRIRRNKKGVKLHSICDEKKPGF